MAITGCASHRKFKKKKMQLFAFMKKFKMLSGILKDVIKQ